MKATLLILLIAFLGGCAGPGYRADDYVSQRLPRLGQPESAVHVSDDVDVVWRRIVGRMSESPLFITDVDRESRLIIAEFSAPNPADYLDCGTAEGEYVQRSDTTQTELRLAEGGRIEWGLQTRKHTGVNVESRGSLELTATLSGGLNVHLAPTQSGTDVMVNARYLLDIAQRGARIAGGTRSELGFDEAFAFTTHGREQYRTMSPVTSVLRCTPTGALEHLVLDMARE